MYSEGRSRRKEDKKIKKEEGRRKKSDREKRTTGVKWNAKQCYKKSSQKRKQKR